MRLRLDSYTGERSSLRSVAVSLLAARTPGAKLSHPAVAAAFHAAAVEVAAALGLSPQPPWPPLYSSV